MSSVESLSHPLDIVRLAFKYPLRWSIPALLVAVVVGAIAVVKPDTWEASQQLVVRNDAAQNHDGPGKFRHSDELKSLLETILELSRSQVVLHAALVQVDGREPTEIAVSELADLLKLSPPKGGEFGKSEVFYLKIKDHSRSRAIALCHAVCDQLEKRFRELRSTRARGMVEEVTRTEALTQTDVLAATQKMQELEQAVGADLAELRNLHQSNSGADSDLRRKSLEMEHELRQAVTEERRRHEWYKVLAAAQGQSEQLASLPSFAEVMPGLNKLKESLIAAQVQSSLLMGKMTAEHPDVRAAKSAETEIARNFEHELAAAIRAAELDWKLAVEQVTRLRAEIPQMRERLARLASLRSEYARLANEVENRTKLMHEAQRQLVEARAAQTSADVASLITRVDEPLTGPKPQGPGKSVLLASGIVGGGIIGLGALLLSLNIGSPPLALQVEVHEPRVSPIATQGVRRLSLGAALRTIFSAHAAPAHPTP